MKMITSAMKATVKFIALLAVVFCMTASGALGACSLSTHTNFTNFNASSNPGAQTTLWLNVHTKLTGQLAANGNYIMFAGGTLTFNNIGASVGSSVSLPSGEIIADNTVSTPTTSFNFAKNMWITKVPLAYSSSDIFISGAAIISSSGFTVSSGQNTVLTGNFYTNLATFSSSWFYGMSCYQPTFINATAGTINSVSGIPTPGLGAGAPDNQTANLVAGGSGGGGTNYTGSYSATDNFTTTCPPPLVASIQGTSTCGSGNGAVSVSASGGTVPYTYKWASSGSGATNVSGSTTAVITGLASGTYSVTVTDKNSNTVTLSTTVTNTVTNIIVSPDTAICIGGSAQLRSSGASIYAWTPDATLNDSTLANPIATPTVTTTYTITGSNFTSNLVYNGDFSLGNTGFTSAYTYISPAANAATSGGNQGLVPEGVYAIDTNANKYHPAFFGHGHTTSAANNFMIINGAPTFNVMIWSQTINNVLPNTTYYFTTWVSSMNLITNYANLVFTIDGAQIGATIVSPVDTNHWVQFSAVWNSGSNTSATISIVNQDTIRNGNDFGLDDISFSTLCPASKQVKVTVNPLPTVDAGPNDTICAPSTSVDLSATGTGTGLSYHWSTGANTQGITVSPATNTFYYVTVTDVNTCKAKDSLEVFKSATALSATGSVTNITTCFGATTGGASVIASNGTVPYTYKWSPGGQTASSISSQAAGIYTVTVTDALKCTVVVNDTIKQPTQLTLVGGTDSVKCNGGSNGDAKVTPSGGTPTIPINGVPHRNKQCKPRLALQLEFIL